MKKSSVFSRTICPFSRPSCRSVIASKNSSMVPMPPGRARKASLSANIFSFRAAMVSVRISSSHSGSRIPGSLNIRGAIPMTFPPAAFAPRAQAPISPSAPPPNTTL